MGRRAGERRGAGRRGASGGHFGGVVVSRWRPPPAPARPGSGAAKAFSRLCCKTIPRLPASQGDCLLTFTYLRISWNPLPSHSAENISQSPDVRASTSAPSPFSPTRARPLSWILPRLLASPNHAAWCLFLCSVYHLPSYVIKSKYHICLLSRPTPSFTRAKISCFVLCFIPNACNRDRHLLDA